MAAGLVAMAARFAPEDWARRAEVVGRAEELRARIEPLADADAAAYGEFLAARTEETRARIVEIPDELAALASEVAELAALVAVEGNPSVSGDAAAGATLAAAAAGIAARLVTLNGGDPQPSADHVRTAVAAATRAVAEDR